MARTCQKCGSMVEDNAKFCDECGEPLYFVNENPESQTINMYAEKQNVSSVQPKINMYNTGYMQNAETNVPISSGKKALGIISLVCGIFSIVTIGCWIFPEIVAIVCGILTKDATGKRTKLGNVGFMCGIIGTVLFVLVIILL